MPLKVNKYMTEVNKDKFFKALKSVAWRIGMMALAVIVKFLIDSLGWFELNPTITTILGLILGEVSKIINKNLQELKGLAGKK